MPVQRKTITPITTHLHKEETWDRALRVVEPGDEFHVRGHRGRFVFLSITTNTRTGAQWVDAFGPVGQHGQHRSFDPERVTTVHRDRTHRKEVAA